MDELIDRLARGVAQATDRRDFLRWLGQGTAAALTTVTAGVLGARGAAAQGPGTETTCCVYCCLNPGAPRGFSVETTCQPAGTTTCPPRPNCAVAEPLQGIDCPTCGAANAELHRDGDGLLICGLL